MARRDRRIERAAEGMGHAVAERRGERRRRLADQEGAADAREERRQRGDPALLGAAAGDPVDGVVAGEGVGGGGGVGGLAESLT